MEKPKPTSLGPSDTESETDDQPIKVPKSKKWKVELDSEEEEEEVDEEVADEKENDKEQAVDEVGADEQDIDEEEGEELEEEDEEEDNDESDSDCVPQKIKNEDYFTNHTTKNNRQRCLVGF